MIFVAVYSTKLARRARCTVAETSFVEVLFTRRARLPAAVYPDPLVRIAADDALCRGYVKSCRFLDVAGAVAGIYGFDDVVVNDLVFLDSLIPYGPHRDDGGVRPLGEHCDTA